MLRANILILDRDLASVIKEIGSLGIMHLVDHASVPGLADMGWTPGQELEILSRYQSSKRQLDEIFTQTEIAKETKYTHAKYDVNPLKDIDDLETRIGDLYAQIRAINEQIFTLRDKLAFEEDNLRRAKNIAVMNADVAFMRSLENMRMIVGYVPVKQLPFLKEAVTTKFTVHIPLEQRADRQKAVFFCLPGDSEQLENQLKTLGFDPIPLPEDCSGIPEEAIKELEGKIEEINVSIAESENRLRGFGWTYRGELLRIRDHLTTNLDILKSVKSMGLSEHTALITGWIPKDSLEKLAAAFEDDAW